MKSIRKLILQKVLVMPALVLLTGAAWLTVLVGACKSEDSVEPEDNAPTLLVWKKPANFPDPVYDLSKNPLTVEGVELGKFLFYDGMLSRTNVIGCGTCHQQQSAFTHHGHELSHGVDDQLGKRNTPSIQNMAWNPLFFWDGGVRDMDFVPFNPIENPVEMGETVNHVLEKLRLTPDKSAKIPVDYPNMFKAAFGTPEITTERMMKALSQFMTTLVSAESRYDKFAMGDVTALSVEEKEGLILFRKNCSSCHEGELFTNFSFRNNGLAPLKNEDLGRFDVTRRESDRNTFKVPSLRNVSFTAPYMHDGRYKTLGEVLEHYTDKVTNLPTLDSAFIQKSGKTGLNLTDIEKESIIAFLRTLSDDNFIKNNAFSDPGIGNAF
ncbi:cytochrome-c peroxidase [Dyadobacter sp. CY345]|uniref:cytochrome-c peroxidase n=1 Tax=Dyadobacter sp. CY345 TaxID=2909335 RepID=UPI001F3A3004|nr:cytochrome c peroxidase [Dyadobacter sp. CY345]MCF2443498.1 cytochrome-c peroxidase [Dyadobacter sp. CY345]